MCNNILPDHTVGRIVQLWLVLCGSCELVRMVDTVELPVREGGGGGGGGGS